MHSNTVEMVGFPDFWQKAEAANTAAFEAIKDLFPIQQVLFSKPVSKSLHKVTRMIAKVTCNSLTALMVLVLNGCGSDAMKIARSMFEASVTLDYLLNHPEQVTDFLEFKHIQDKRRLCFLDSQNSKHRIDFPDERRAEIESEYKRVLPRYAGQNGKPRRSWCRKNVYEMAQELNVVELYRTFYEMASSLHHVDISAVIPQDSDALDITTPSRDWILDALRMGHMTALATLSRYNEVACHGMEGQLKGALDAFKQAWNG